MRSIDTIRNETITGEVEERIGRTSGAKFLPPAMFVVALALIVAGSLLDGDAMKLYTMQLEIGGGVLAIIACILERLIQRQIHLANVGIVTEATVVQRWTMRMRNGTREFARYVFATETNKTIEKKCYLREVSACCIEVNSRIAVVYDPQHPRHAARVEDLWAAKLSNEVARDENGHFVGRLE